MTGERQVGARRDGHFFSPANVLQVHGIVNIYHTWAMLPLGYSGRFLYFCPQRNLLLREKLVLKLTKTRILSSYSWK